MGLITMNKGLYSTPEWLSWLGWLDLNQRIHESKSCALATWRHPNIKLGANYLCPEIGIEPIIFAFEANVLTF